MLPNTLSPEQVAEVLGVKVQTLATWRCHRTVNLPWIKIGRRVQYRESDVLAFIEANVMGTVGG